MKTTRPVGICGYGAYVPRLRIDARSIARVWGRLGRGFPVPEKSFPGADEDTITMSIEAARAAVDRAGIDAQRLSAVWVGTESKPYAVKPSATVVAEAIGATPFVNAADLEFACKAGSEGMQMAAAFVGSGMAEYAMAVGMDTAQGKPGDELEYTAAAGGAAYIFGPAESSAAKLAASLSFVTDTPDFFRRAHMRYPEHGMRFTGRPSYFHHTLGCARALLEETGLKPADFRWAVFHQPNPRFPREAAAELGFKPAQFERSLVCARIGNTYAGSSLLGLASVLDVAAPGERILMVSYGSGAGSDGFVFETTERVAQRRDAAPSVDCLLDRRQPVTEYARYLHNAGKIRAQ
ncbi:MAG: hydroxymethylglutaryl-CoA synthase [Elusimicrobia bacterium GWA2_69_24]|nr:MAG: hydroxymethylglutaryl-CoA synthase [Elusimicrobia bacterium GWA2_69_24]HBL15229.1 hydroxymethylglutaryl-CoA synthase [Elusimicrobiota bacterium]